MGSMARNIISTTKKFIRESFTRLRTLSLARITHPASPGQPPRNHRPSLPIPSPSSPTSFIHGIPTSPIDARFYRPSFPIGSGGSGATRPPNRTHGWIRACQLHRRRPRTRATRSHLAGGSGGGGAPSSRHRQQRSFSLPWRRPVSTSAAAPTPTTLKVLCLVLVISDNA
jgi:hypothetical protein